MKKYIMTPGPTPIPPDVLLEGAGEIIHHRTPEYKEVTKRVNEGLKYVFQTKNPVFYFASSGTGAMEACVCNILSSQDMALVLVAGKFGERWEQICKAWKIKTEVITAEPGYPPDISKIQDILSKNKIKAVFATLCETSTGVLTDIKAIGKLCKEYNSLLVVDAISGLCADELLTDEWGVDMAVSGSQKGLMTPPGLAFVSVSEKALAASEESDLPKFYFSIPKAYKAYQDDDTPFTPAITLVRSLCIALDKIKNEGIENILKRTEKLARATRAAISAIGLEIFSKSPSSSLTAIRVPNGISAKELNKRIKNTYGVNIAKGQGELEDVIFRIAHMGYIERFDIITTIAALEMSLFDLGFKIKLGSGVGEAEKVLRES